MTGLRALALALVAGWLTACGGPDTGAKIPRAEPAPGSAPPASAQPSTSQAAAPSLGAAPANLRTVDWPNTPLPGEFCDIPGIVAFRNGEAMATSTRWGQVHVATVWGQEGVAYGDLDGDGRDEAAVIVECDNGGGTAGGQLAFGYVVVGVAGESLRALGSIVTKHEPADATHSTLMGGAEITPSQVAVTELWYRPSDANCCPSGVARTTWSYRDGTLVAGTPVIVS